MERTQHRSGMDLQPGTPYRVRLYRLADQAIIFDGETTFDIGDDVPFVRSLGKRWRIRAACFPQDVITGQLPGYRPGDHMIEYGERYALYLLDRYDPALAAAKSRVAMEMALDAFAIQEGIDDIRFE